jgi:L-threonylcarbamoyladenylate synthase
VGIRRSSDAFAQALVEAAGKPVTSTSANRAGQKPLATAQVIAEEFGDQLDLIIDAGPRQGEPSTVVDLTGAEMKLVRRGGIKFNHLERVIHDQD